MKIEKDYIYGLTLADERSRETARLREKAIGGYSLDQLNNVRPLRHQQHSIPKGCQWARDCEECPWHDCIIEGNNDVDYDSKKAQTIRRRLALDLSSGKVSLVCAAHQMHVELDELERYVCQLLPETGEYRIELIQMFQEKACSTRELAEHFGVHVRTARRCVSTVSTPMKRATDWGRAIRDTKVMQLTSKGVSVQDIAACLGIVERTVSRIRARYSDTVCSGKG